MKQKLIWNDLKKNKLLSVTTFLFMAVSALLFSLTGLLLTGLLGSVDALMEKAKTPDFLQMHAGEMDSQEIRQLVGEKKEVADWQTICFLNLENGRIFLNGKSLSDSTQDNGVCVQSDGFDYLLDLNNEIITVQEGEIYVPVCYRQQYGLEEGMEIQIGEESFVLAGFLRDSQMNSMLASSKRFLVSSADYERLRPEGTEEYLIEFLLQEGTDVNAFSAEYSDAGLPSNGPTITKPLIRMMNALSDGMMIFVILLVGVLMLFISMLCIYFTLLARLAADRREIGMLKAIGIGKKEIRNIYFSRFAVLSVTGAAFGILAAYGLKKPLSAQMRELYGTAQSDAGDFFVSLLCVVLTEAVLLLSIRRTLKRTERLSAVEALTGREDKKSGKKGSFSLQYLIVMLVIAAGVFLMVVPGNLQSTISSPRFVTYMGIGEGEIRIDIRQTDNIVGKTRAIEKMLKEDGRVSRYAVFLTRSYRMTLPDGTYTNLNVETGNHTIFPVTYAKGEAPTKKGEIALSCLCAEEMGLEVGDAVSLEVKGGKQTYRVCGIYSDITNGGKTAKAACIEDDGPVMWSVCYVSLKQKNVAQQWLSECSSKFSRQGINAKAVDIEEYVKASYGQTMRQIRLASGVASGAAVLVMFIVTLLFVRLITARERYSISLRKALGFTGKEIKRIYFIRYLTVILAGILFGLLGGNILGEKIVGVLFGSFGAAGFRFIVDGKIVFFIIPFAAFFATMLAAAMGLREIKNIKAYECCTGKE